MLKKRIRIFAAALAVLVCFSLFATFNVSAAASGVTISKPHYSVQIGSTVQLEYSGSGITWSSSDKSVASVSSTGVVTGVSMGVATITARSGSYSASCEITSGFYKGIDVSSWNGEYNSNGYYVGPVNWSKVKAEGIDFAILRAGYGWEDYPYQNDNDFVHNVKGCVDNDIPFGIYFYSYATTPYEASLEAQYLIRELNEYIPAYKNKMTLPIAYDLEESYHYTMSSTNLTNIILTFCNAVQDQGNDAMVYGNTSTFNNMNLSTLQANDISFWYAWPTSNPDFSEPVTIGSTGIVPDIWQYSWTGTVNGAGASNGVDMNIIYMLSSTNTDSFKSTSTTASYNASSNTATLNWNSVSSASYNLYRCPLTDSGDVNSSARRWLYTGRQTSFTDSTMQYGTAYYYYTDTLFSGDFLDPDYQKTVSGYNNGCYVYNVNRGDVDLNEGIDLLDAILTQKATMGLTSLSEIERYAADYNANGTVNLSDAIAIQKILLKLS